MEELPALYFMRARYFSAEAGLFFSTDAVKKIGPTWKPAAYSYALNNPLANTDPTGLLVFLLGGQVGGSAAAGGGVAGSDSVSVDLAIDLRGHLGLYNTVCGGIQTGEGLDASAAVELGIATVPSIDDLSGPSAYVSGGGGAAGHLTGSVSLDPSGIPSGYTADIGLEAGEHASFGGGACYTSPVNLPSPKQVFWWAASDPITANGGTVGNSTPMLSSALMGSRDNSSSTSPFSSGPLSGGSGGGSSWSAPGTLSRQTVGAATFANLATAISATREAGPSIGSGTAFGSSGQLGISLGGGGISTATAGPTPAYIPPSSQTGSSGSSGNIFTTAWNWFTGLFGGHH